MDHQQDEKIEDRLQTALLSYENSVRQIVTASISGFELLKN